MGNLLHEQLTGQILDAAIEVHRTLGPGLLESAYEACLARELTVRGIAYQRQLPLPVEYKGEKVDVGYRLDLLVEGRVIVELKACDELHPIHEAQMFTHMRLAGVRVGMLINFNVTKLMDGYKRRVL